jgi:hypothetical protein
MSYYKIQNFEQYFKHYNKSVREPRKFWGKIAEENFTWYQLWDKVVEFDMAEAEIKWFTEAKLNIAKNCIDRHLNKENETAIILSPMTLLKKPCIFPITNCINGFAKWQMFCGNKALPKEIEFVFIYQ